MKAIRILTAIMLTLVMAIGVTSCSSGDDDDSGSGVVSKNYEKAIIGSWTYGNATYSFDGGGTGRFKAEDNSGSISYTLQGTTIHMQIVIWNEKYHSVWRTESTGKYSPEQDVIFIDGYRYTRQQ